MMDSKSGRIDIIMGSMFSGKSTEAIRIINRYKVLEKNMLIINHVSDDRYKKNCIATHSNMSIDCFSIENLNDIKTNSVYNYKDRDVIVIEEAQFFDKLYDFCIEAADNDNKIVVIIGLDGDSNRNQFGDIVRLIPHCDSVKKLHALCVKCKNGTLASFTKRLVKSSSQVLIGVNEFIPVCRYHYNN